MRPQSIVSINSNKHSENGGLRSKCKSNQDLNNSNFDPPVIRSSGIVRIRVNCDPVEMVSDTRVGKSVSKNEEHPKDDDTDSAISVETGDDSIDGQPNSQSIRRRSHDDHQSKMLTEDSELPKRVYQRRFMAVKKTSNFSGSAASKAKSVLKQQSGDTKHQLSASSGTSTLPAWKLRKAMKNFKATNLAGENGACADFGAPHIQYFLASLCDHPASTLTSSESKTSISSLDAYPDDNGSVTVGLRARCPLAAEVKKVVSKLRSSEPVNAQGFQLSVAVTVLKEFLSGIPGGVFGELTEEFYQISLESSLELTIMYLHSILHEMPYVVQQFTYLLCKALRNLIRLTGGSSIKNYTDLLMHFTPVLFASSVGDVGKFLRAARLLLVMVDDCERVFFPLPWLDAKGNWCWHNGDFEDESFFRQIFDSLQNLEARLATDDSGVESEPDESSLSSNAHELSSEKRTLSTCSLVDFYQVVYVDDAEYSSNDDAVDR